MCHVAVHFAAVASVGSCCQCVSDVTRSETNDEGVFYRCISRVASLLKVSHKAWQRLVFGWRLAAAAVLLCKLGTTMTAVQ